jgi:hypothetical protein
MKINRLKKEIRKKRKELVCLQHNWHQQSQTMANTDHVGMKRNLNGTKTHYPALSMAATDTSTKMKVMKLTLKLKKKTVMNMTLG